jgi:hypothetical protein
VSGACSRRTRRRVGGELLEGAGGAAQERRDVPGDPFGVALGGQEERLVFISAICPGIPARTIASLSCSKVSSWWVTVLDGERDACPGLTIFQPRQPIAGLPDRPMPIRSTATHRADPVSPGSTRRHRNDQVGFPWRHSTVSHCPRPRRPGATRAPAPRRTTSPPAARLPVRSRPRSVGHNPSLTPATRPARTLDWASDRRMLKLISALRLAKTR